MAHYALARLYHAQDHTLSVPWEYGTQVNELAGHSLPLCKVTHRLEGAKLRSPAHDLYVAFCMDNFGLAKRCSTFGQWDLLYRQYKEYLSC
jgi:hypothetical protein